MELKLNAKFTIVFICYWFAQVFPLVSNHHQYLFIHFPKNCYLQTPLIPSFPPYTNSIHIPSSFYRHPAEPASSDPYQHHLWWKSFPDCSPYHECHQLADLLVISFSAVVQPPYRTKICFEHLSATQKADCWCLRYIN